MRITDPRWPALRELARRVLREGEPVLKGPAFLEQGVMEIGQRIADQLPARITFPIHEHSESSFWELVDEGTETPTARCTQEEPPINILWIPMNPKDGWAAFLIVVEDLLDAGYPGCVGCVGSLTEEEWDESASRASFL